MLYKIPIERLPELFASIAEISELYVPIRKGKAVNFGKWVENCEIDLKAVKTVMPPKGFFLPQTESLYDSTTQQGKIDIYPKPLANRPLVLFGVRPCDAEGLHILDTVYFKEPTDRFYETRRDMGCIISLACNNPVNTCLCNVFDIDAANPAGDIGCWIDEMQGILYWQDFSEKGELFTMEIKMFQDADEFDFDKLDILQNTIRKKIDALPYAGLPLENLKPERLLEIFDSAVWEDLHKVCLACGTCTFMCPTCQCYDIMDFDCGEHIKRFRCWDSCMYSDFTLMAHGNPRQTQKERFRQRFMHKLIYHAENNNGRFGCVGCGRCIECPSSLSIIKVIKALGKEATNFAY